MLLKDAASHIILAAYEAENLSKQERSFFEHHPVGGVTLFKRNIPTDFYQLRNCVRQLQNLDTLGLPFIIAIDQEGGRVNRMPSGFPNDGPALYLESGRFNEGALHAIESYASKVGRTLKNLGVNVNFAPVCDILTHLPNGAIGDRVFGLDKDSAAKRASAFLKGMQKEKVLGCLKHFPGQGNAGADTHLRGAQIDLSQGMIWSRECHPFRELLPQSHMVMMSHCVYSDIDFRPASLSHKVQTEWLRQRMGYEGLILSDDMNMHAVAQDLVPWINSLIQALLAGTDLLLICKDVDRIEKAIEGIYREAAKSSVLQARVFDAASRVVRLRKTIPPR